MKIDELLGYAKDTKEELDDLNEKVDDLNEKVDDIKDAFEETAGRSVPDPMNECDKSEFVLLQSKILPNEFSFMRGIQSYNDVKLNKKYAADYNIIKREYNANPVQLFRTLQDTVKEQYKLEKSIIQANKKLKNKRELYKQLEKIKFNGTKIILTDYTLNDLLDKITEVSIMKYKEYNDTTEDTP
jgi:predicted  nucleic acid-binding Zn-ribbon protein